MPAFRFDGCVFDPRRRTLVRNGEVVKVSRRAFEALHLLLRRYPDAVSKNELSEALWPDTFVNQTNLNNVIAEIRKAVDDRGRRVIVTKHRFGYAIETPVTAESRAVAVPSRFAIIIGRETVRLSSGENVVGRSPDAAVVIDDASVSRRHAVVSIEGDRVAVADLGSKNGTFVGDVRVKDPHPLTEKDVVRFGSVCGIFRLLPAAGTTVTADVKPVRD